MNTCASYGNIIPPHLIFKMSKVNFTVSLYLGCQRFTIWSFFAAASIFKSVKLSGFGLLLLHHVTKLFISHKINHVSPDRHRCTLLLDQCVEAYNRGMIILV